MIASDDTRDVVLVDFDAVTFKSEACALVDREALSARSGRTVDRWLWRRVAGARDARDHVLDALFAIDALNPYDDDTEAARWWQERQYMLTDCLPLSASVRIMPSVARNRGVRLNVVSSDPPAWIAPHLRRLGILERFERIVSGDDLAPMFDIAVHLATLRKYAIRPKWSTAIEDSSTGLRSAHDAGADCIGLAYSMHDSSAPTQANWAIDFFKALWPACSTPPCGF